MPLIPADIARVCRAPILNVESTWPRILYALRMQDIEGDLSEVAAAATIAVETARAFQPIHECGSPAYFTKHYEDHEDLGNTEPGDGARFHPSEKLMGSPPGRLSAKSAGFPVVRAHGRFCRSALPTPVHSSPRRLRSSLSGGQR